MTDPTNGNSTKTYAGSFIYNDNGLEYALFEEGRLLESGGVFEYQYFLKVVAKQKSRFFGNHLGNTRVTFSGNTGLIQQQDHYYPFGMNFAGIDNVAGLANLYKYNGKELQADLDLNWYDYGARFYDPTIARWSVVDPWAEIYYSSTPFSYVANNPIRLIDPNGMSYKESMDEQYGEGNYWYRGQAPGTWGNNTEASMAGFNLNIQSNLGIYQSEGDQNSQVSSKGRTKEKSRGKLTNSHYFSDIDEAYKFIWENSHDSKGNPMVETSAWMVKRNGMNGVIVLPNNTNYLTESDNSRLKMRWNEDGQMQVQHFSYWGMIGQWYDVVGQIHSHVEYNKNDIGFSGTDKKMIDFVGAPIIILWQKKIWEVKSAGDIKSIGELKY